MSKPGLVIIVLALILLAAQGGCGLPAGEHSAPDSDNGDEQYQFSAAEMFTGKAVNFPDDYRGGVVYLNFFFDG